MWARKLPNGGVQLFFRKKGLNAKIEDYHKNHATYINNTIGLELIPDNKPNHVFEVYVNNVRPKRGTFIEFRIVDTDPPSYRSFIPYTIQYAGNTNPWCNHFHVYMERLTVRQRAFVKRRVDESLYLVKGDDLGIFKTDDD